MKLLFHKLKNDLQVSNSIFLILQKGGVSVLGYAFWVVAAHLFPASEVGVATALFAAMWLVVVISLLGLGETLVRFLPTSLDKPTMVSTSLFTVIATSVLDRSFLYSVPGCGALISTFSRATSLSG